MTPSLSLPRTLDEITPAWLTGALRDGGGLVRANVVAVAVQPIDQEFGFLDGLARFRLTYDCQEQGSPASVVVKLPAGQGTYRQIGDRYHAYEREIHFYGEVAPGSPIRLARCFYRGMDPAAGAYVLVLEDLGDLTAGDQVRGLTPDQVGAAVETLARLQARWWQTPALEALEWMPRRNLRVNRYRECWPRFRQTIGPHLPAAAMKLGEQVAEHLDELLLKLEQPPGTIVHADFRADNLLFGDPDQPDPVVIVDWQLAIRGRGVLDVARLLCGSVPSPDRAVCETAILRRWHQTLEAEGVTGYTFQQSLADYRRAALLCLYYPVTIHEAEEGAGKRGTALADAQISRFFTAALELDAGAVLPG